MTKDTDAREGEAALRLRTLELQGFKSFPDHTVLTFDHPVTAIVGPNGSGKSNLSDAICWVLGEQSARTLRGDKMEDVIFSGAQLRQRLGAAQVTLRLEDETGGEMAVTRRYYRSGESEYLLNGKTVRLRDVHERFMDTGLGQEGYALIGQGKIDAILSAKSTQRREIFEEAAGISHCRHQKEETQRKLERTQENLTRVADKLEELDLQRGPLKAQAEQAQTFLALREKLRTLEISLWMDQLDKQRAQRRKLQADRAAAQASLAACTQETDRLYAESERLLHDLRDQEAQGERLRQRLQAVRQQAEDSRQALTLRRERLRTGDETARRLRDALAQQEARIAHLQEEQTRQEDRLAQLQKQERKRAEAIARTEERLARARTQARQAQAAWQETLRREREALAARHREEQAAEEAWMACRLEAHTLAARQKLLGDLASQLEGYARGVKTAMTAARRGELTGVLGPVGQLFHVESRYTVALETALGGAMQDLLVEDEQAGKAVLRLVKRRDGGRVTCRPLTALRPNPLREEGLEEAPGFLAVAAELVDCDERVRPAAQSLLGRTVVVDDLDHGTALAKARRYRFPVVTLDGEILRPGGAMTGGSVSRRGGILSRGAEEAALREKLAQAQERLAEAQHTLEHARQARQLAAQTLDKRQANGPDETIEWTRRQQAQEEDLRAQREEWATLQGTLTAFAPLLAQLRQQLDTADRDRQRQEEALALSARQKEVWTAEIHQLETALDELDQQAERLTAQADQATQDKFALEKRRADTGPGRPDAEYVTAQAAAGGRGRRAEGLAGRGRGKPSAGPPVGHLRRDPPGCPGHTAGHPGRGPGPAAVRQTQGRHRCPGQREPGGCGGISARGRALAVPHRPEERCGDRPAGAGRGHRRHHPGDGPALPHRVCQDPDGLCRDLCPALRRGQGDAGPGGRERRPALRHRHPGPAAGEAAAEHQPALRRGAGAGGHRTVLCHSAGPAHALLRDGRDRGGAGRGQWGAVYPLPQNDGTRDPIPAHHPPPGDHGGRRCLIRRDHGAAGGQPGAQAGPGPGRAAAGDGT